MKVLKNRFLILLLALFFTIDAFLFWELTSHSKNDKAISEDKKEKATQEETSLEVENNMSDIGVNLNESEVWRLVRDFGLVDGNGKVSKNDSIEKYYPQKIIFSFNEVETLPAILTDTFLVDGKNVYGYVPAEKGNDNYTLEYYFTSDYVKQNKETVLGSIKSLLVKSAFLLGKINEKGRRPTNLEMNEFYKNLPDYLKNYSPLDEI